MNDYDETMQNTCPQCGIGRVQAISKPYVKLFLGQLFTVPDALCYQCDVCHFSEFDGMTFEIISDMMLGASLSSDDDPAPSRPLNFSDKMPRRPKPTQF
ncbi:MAG: hypothetical protein ACFE0Q_06705 [Anaerolineae bacterium]